MDKDRPPVGSWMDWCYDLNGIMPMAIELWDMAGHAGLPKLTPKQSAELPLEAQERNQLALLQWNDREMAGKLFVNWYSFDHPQLGPVELGGWLPKTAFQNPPLELLEGECHKCAMFTIEHAAMAPRFVIESLGAEDVGAATEPGKRIYRLTAAVANLGYLPTNVTQQAINMHVAKPLSYELTASGPTAMTILAGKAKDEFGQLPGHGTPTGFWGYFSPETRKKLEWVIAAAPGTEVTLKAGGPKCGTKRATLDL